MKYEIDVKEEIGYEFTKELIEEAKKKGINLPLKSFPMSMCVKGMLRNVESSIDRKDWKDRDTLKMLLKTYAQLWVNDQLGIETCPITKEVLIDKFENIPKEFLKKGVDKNGNKKA